MNANEVWPQAQTIVTGRLQLEPLSVAHASEMVGVLADEALYLYTGGEPPTLTQLERRYSTQIRGESADGSSGWLNWILRRQGDAAPIGYVQATLERREGQLLAAVAWVISPSQQGQGMASEAAAAMVGWLRTNGVCTFEARIDPLHHASMAVARKLGLHASGELADGEMLWAS